MFTIQIYYKTAFFQVASFYNKYENGLLEKEKPMNKLANENSLYLKQHAKNPVNWFPWGTEAFDKAKKENKPLIVSIGYSSCHWCHVMENEVFEHADAAKIMNEHYICIKVDCEERPDVDQVYMDAVQMITGSGGWPLNVFVLPDGRPFYGGTYFPKNQWLSLLQKLAVTYQNQYDLVDKTANEIQNKVNGTEQILHTAQGEESSYNDLVTKFFEGWKQNYDTKNGGDKGVPKFPMPVRLDSLLDFSLAENQKEIEEQVLHTLEKIASGGIYDHVGGGFSRYSVDEQWHVPHFEKMLYDNAQLLPLYTKAASITGNKAFRMIADETFAFLEREMLVEKGMYASAIDADSEGVEGKFYVWDYEQFLKVAEDKQWAAFFQVKPEGNWEKTNVLHVSDNRLFTEINDNQYEFLSQLKKLKQKLLTEREKRVRPVRDNKAITAWNAMLAVGFTESYAALGEIQYLEKARDVLNQIKKAFEPEQKLPRILNYDAGEGMLDDYAFAAQAAYQLYTIKHEKEWLLLAHRIFSKAIDLFKEPEKSLLNYSPLKTDLYTRKTEWMDTVQPSSNAVIAQIAWDLGYVLKLPEVTNLSVMMLQTMNKLLQKHPLMLTGWMKALFNHHKKLFVSIGNKVDHNEVRKYFRDKGLMPDILPGEEIKPDEILICRGQICYTPVKSIEEALEFTK